MSEQKYMAGTTLAERQMFFFNGHKCPYCLKETEFVDSIEIYKHTSYGMAFLCRPCKAWVGTHSNSDQSLGSLAKKELRDLRHQAHQLFDPLCDAKVQQGSKRKTAKSAGYKWLAEILGISTVECHIGYFGEDRCKIVIEECKKIYEVFAKNNEEAKRKADLCHSLAAELNFECTEFSMNGITQMELIKKDGSKFTYHPKKNEGKWIEDKKMQPIEDIQMFIYSNFI